MTPEEFKQAIIEAFEEYGTEESHKMADVIMCDLLRALGYGDGVDIFEQHGKWWA
jgi:hypothetical protein